MTEIEATGAPAACARCGRAAPAGSHPEWGGLMLNGRLVQLACPDYWLGLEEVLLPPRVRELALRVAGSRG